MKNYFTSSFICFLLLFSCKKEIKKEEEMTEKEELKKEVVVKTNTYKHSLAQWSLHEPFQNGSLDPMNFADIAKDLGFTGLEYVTQLYPQIEEATGKPDYQEAVMQLADEWLERSKQAGMDNVLIMVDHAGELADPDPVKRAVAIENHKYWIDAAQRIGAHSVRANLFGELDPVKWHAISVASLKELGSYGKTKGINVIIENHGGWSSDGAKLAAVMEEVGMEYVGTLPDFGNFCVAREGGERWEAPCINEYDMYKGTMELMPFAKGVSAKSYNFDEHGNETKIDYGRMFKIIQDSGFKGYVGTEYEGPLDDPKEGIKLTKALVEKSIHNLK